VKYDECKRLQLLPAPMIYGDRCLRPIRRLNVFSISSWCNVSYRLATFQFWDSSIRSCLDLRYTYIRYIYHVCLLCMTNYSMKNTTSR